jgi:hypothetical protein
MYFSVEAESVGKDINPVNNRVNMTLDIVYPDLTFDTAFGQNGIEIIGKKVTDGSELEIQIQMRNMGKAVAGDITVGLYIDGEFMDSRFIDSLETSLPGEFKDKPIKFSWKPSEGKHIIEVRIDPMDTIIELDEENNVASTEIIIKPESEASRALGLNLIMLFVLVIVIIIVLIIIWFLTKRRRRAEEEEAPAPPAPVPEVVSTEVPEPLPPTPTPVPEVLSPTPTPTPVPEVGSTEGPEALPPTPTPTPVPEVGSTEGPETESQPVPAEEEPSSE